MIRSAKLARAAWDTYRAARREGWSVRQALGLVAYCLEHGASVTFS